MPKQNQKRLRVLFIALSFLGALLILFFGLRTFRAFKRFEGHQPPPISGELDTNVEDIEDWMTIPFISRSYGVPPEILFDALAIPANENHKKSLKQLNDEYYPKADGYVISVVKATVQAHQPPPMPDPPNGPNPPETTP